ncbi:hypothetical protein [Niabella beijingensis]|uniref:hypothetical protein n=1 Tax=Niabella beijingensis TaxID=2872700 RepID=UPI001CBF1740|nr:hypothetical protein [Niabella beijingensis]MBZ4188069.1 hypothetical protein [Niabella beijingensis]
MKVIAAIPDFSTAALSTSVKTGWTIPVPGDTGGNRMVEQQIPLKFTRSGKWNLATGTTRRRINTGQHTVRLLLKKAKNLVVSNIDIQ